MSKECPLEVSQGVAYLGSTVRLAIGSSIRGGSDLGRRRSLLGIRVFALARLVAAAALSRRGRRRRSRGLLCLLLLLLNSITRRKDVS